MTGAVGTSAAGLADELLEALLDADPVNATGLHALGRRLGAGKWCEDL